MAIPIARGQALHPGLRFEIPSNFEPGLVERVRGTHAFCMYARLARDVVGGGRSPVLLPDVSRRRVAEHIAECHAAGIRFNYVLNSPSMDNVEFTRRGHNRLRALLDWIDEAGADEVTVTVPLLLDMVKRHNPRLDVVVSTFAGITSPGRARRWQDLGADCLTLSVTGVGRSVRTIEAIRRAVDIEIQVIANLLCVQDCPYDQYHGVIEGHASQKGHALDGYVIDYCRLNCLKGMLDEPAKFLRASWIRPEDQKVYEDLGVDRLKLVSRQMPTDLIGTIVDAYRARRFDGNLFELLGFPGTRAIGGSGWRSAWRKFRYFARPQFVNVFKLRRAAAPIVEVGGFYLDNRALDGFIDHFLDHDCADRPCEECGHCDRVAPLALRIGPGIREAMARNCGDVSDGLVDGDLFRWDLGGRPRGHS